MNPKASPSAGLRVYVYWNLRTGGFSIAADEGAARGLIIGYASEVLLSDVRCHINHTARVKCLTSKTRVHAGFKGTLGSIVGTFTPTGLAAVAEPEKYLSAGNLAPSSRGRAITYNPKRDESFIQRDDRTTYAGGALVYGRTTPTATADCYAL